MPELEFRQVDVFTDRALAGNALAVFLDAGELSGEFMQALAAETNLSETTFVLPPTGVLAPNGPGADYRIRIFTPNRELPFAGHPSIGTAHVLLEEGRLGELGEGLLVKQEVAIGVLPIEIKPTSDGPMIKMTQGEPRLYEHFPDTGRLTAALGCSAGDIAPSGPGPRVASTGLRQLMVPLASGGAVSSLAPDLGQLAAIERELEITGVSAFAFEKPDAVRVRFFSPTSGILEDPATGSAAGALGTYLAAEGLLEVTGGQAAFTISQGSEIGRPSRIEVTVGVEDGKPSWVKVGGRCVTVLRGRLSI